jgi:hypothetical protein
MYMYRLPKILVSTPSVYLDRGARICEIIVDATMESELPRMLIIGKSGRPRGKIPTYDSPKPHGLLLGGRHVPVGGV